MTSEIFAYKSIRKNFPWRKNLQGNVRNFTAGLEALAKIAKELESPLLAELKPQIVLALKWKFDYLTKTGKSPFLLQKDIGYWIDFLQTLRDLSGQNWFVRQKRDYSKDPWQRTEKAFDFMWPRNTTKEKQFEISSKMAYLRLNQIVSMVPGSRQWFKGKTVLDSGCGPGRYIDAILRLKLGPEKIVGIDSGREIIKECGKRFRKHSHIKFVKGGVSSMPFEKNSFDFIISAGVLHHLPNPMETLIREQARVLKPNGYFFMFIAGKGGLELAMWEFARNFLYDVEIGDIFAKFNGKISPLRLQGLLDHGYGEYKQTSREACEKMLKKHFREIKRVMGIEGLDITEEIYKDDLHFTQRFGTGNLRYLCKK